MKSKRLSAAVKFAAALFVLAAVSFTVGCPFYRLTGLKCPGCGVSRMILRFENAVLYGSIAALAVFGVLRNIFPMGFPSV